MKLSSLDMSQMDTLKLVNYRPNYRGHPQKLGKLLSMSRFLFIKANQELFTESIHSELMPPLTPDGSSYLWEAIGTKNFSRWNIGRLMNCLKQTKSLYSIYFPREQFTQSFLPENAIKTIGGIAQIQNL